MARHALHEEGYICFFGDRDRGAAAGAATAARARYCARARDWRRILAPAYATYELLSVFPQETAAGEYSQVDPGQLQGLADLGWQLVSVAPYVYRNEGHPGANANDPSLPPPPLVTQVYLAYFFQRVRSIR